LSNEQPYVRKIEPLADNWRTFAWESGTFDTARRPYTEAVAGTIKVPYHLILVTIRGGAKRLEVRADCGHRYQGADHTGAVSFVPAHCERQFKLEGVHSEWVSIGLSTSLFERLYEDNRVMQAELKSFSNREDPFVFGLLHEFERIYTRDGSLDITYCDSMSYALAHYINRRYDSRHERASRDNWTLTPGKLRQIGDYIDTHLSESIRIAELAELVGISEGHFHRAFRATTGVTPLRFINEKRVQRAVHLLTTAKQRSIVDIAFSVGFLSPSHFARTFRQLMGVNPSQFQIE
jgi:AraC family transcriptional regulator